jgi:hypothetical protein
MNWWLRDSSATDRLTGHLNLRSNCWPRCPHWRRYSSCHDFDSTAAMLSYLEPVVMLITNKYKSSKKGDGKVESSRRIRRMDVGSSKVLSGSKRHDQTACPLCFSKVAKTASGGRRKLACGKCGATLNKRLKCESCAKVRVWQNKLGAACAGCGARFNF